MKTGVLIMNRGAGARGARDAGETAEEIRRSFEAHAVLLRPHLAEAGALAKTCAAIHEDRPELVVAGGGDGTVGTVAGTLAGSRVVLGVLPLGTLNHFARDIGMPADWRDALRCIVAGETAVVDVGELNDRVFINNCSLGAYPEAVRRRDALRFEQGLRKWPAMALAILEVFWRLKRVRLRLEDGQGERLLRTPFVLISNNRYSGHVFEASMRERLDEGRLWIYTTRAHRHLSFLRLAWETLVRRIDLTETLENWSADSIAISPQRPQQRIPVALDGEVSDMTPPLRVRIRPKALTVIVGPGENR